MKEDISKMKRQPSEWEIISVNKATDKELISKIHTQFMQFSKQRNKQPNQKVGKRPKQTFFPKKTSDGQKHMTRCSTSLIIHFSHSIMSDSLQPHGL